MTWIKRNRGESRITGRDIDAGSRAGCTFRMNHLVRLRIVLSVNQPTRWFHDYAMENRFISHLPRLRGMLAFHKVFVTRHPVRLP